MGRLGREGRGRQALILPAITLTAIPSDAAEPLFRLTPATALRFAASATLTGASMHYLISGRKEANLGKMVIGAVLALASLFLI